MAISATPRIVAAILTHIVSCTVQGSSDEENEFEYHRSQAPLRDRSKRVRSQSGQPDREVELFEVFATRRRDGTVGGEACLLVAQGMSSQACKVFWLNHDETPMNNSL